MFLYFQEHFGITKFYGTKWNYDYDLTQNASIYLIDGLMVKFKHARDFAGVEMEICPTRDQW